MEWTLDLRCLRPAAIGWLVGRTTSEAVAATAETSLLMQKSSHPSRDNRPARRRSICQTFLITRILPYPAFFFIYSCLFFFLSKVAASKEMLISFVVDPNSLPFSFIYDC
jgi:hypothetical protein